MLRTIPKVVAFCALLGRPSKLELERLSLRRKFCRGKSLQPKLFIVAGGIQQHLFLLLLLRWPKTPFQAPETPLAARAGTTKPNPRTETPQEPETLFQEPSCGIWSGFGWCTCSDMYHDICGILSGFILTFNTAHIYLCALCGIYSDILSDIHSGILFGCLLMIFFQACILTFCRVVTFYLTYIPTFCLEYVWRAGGESVSRI